MKSMNKHKLLLASLVASSLLVGCSDSDDNTNNASVFDSYPAEGVFLPYNVLRDDLIDGKSQQPFEIRNGGFCPPNPIWYPLYNTIGSIVP